MRVAEDRAGRPPLGEARRIAGLDAIRFVCAAIVALGHCSKDFEADLAPLLGPRIATFIDEASGVAFNGPAAVVVFFILSGFVVHLPAAQGRPLGAAEYYARRYLRILPPALLVATAYAWLGLHQPGGSVWFTTPLWSIVCELIYYTLYPLLLRSGIRMTHLLAGSAVLAIGAIAANAPLFIVNRDYLALGPWTWLIGLPCWLAGCWLAERHGRFPAVSANTLWLVRLAILALSIFLLILRFHAPGLGMFAGYAVTLSLFAIPVTLWLGLETQFPRRKPPPLDRLGVASYSLYLVHLVALYVVARTAIGGLAGLLLFIVLAATFTAVFHVAIERPSHWLARSVGRWARK